MAYLIHTLTEAACFAVANIRDIAWSPESFRHLSTRQGKKDILKGVAKACTSGDSGLAFDDPIQGKGRGLITLLQLVLLLSGAFTC
jgi:hypothetical protein